MNIRFGLATAALALIFSLGTLNAQVLDDGEGVHEEPVCDPEENLIRNGGFESPLIASTPFGAEYQWDIFAFGTELLEWLGELRAPGGEGRIGLELQAGVAGLAHPEDGGAQFAELDGDHPTRIYQDVPTIPGKTYRLSYYFSPRPGTPAEENILQVSAGEEVLATEARAGGEATDWSAHVHTFVASESVTRIAFADLGNDDNGAVGGVGTYLDNVALVCAGDPETEPPEEPSGPSDTGGGGMIGQTPPECADGSDNDGDGKADASNDPGCADSLDNDETDPPPEEGEVLGVATTTQEEREPEYLDRVCARYASEIVRYGGENAPGTVARLQEFLNDHLDLRLHVSDIYNIATRAAVKQFQSLHKGALLLPWASDTENRNPKYWLLLLKCGELKR